MPDSNAVQDRLAMLYEQSERETDPAVIERLESEIKALETALSSRE